jgi:hypothetical protein
VADDQPANGEGKTPPVITFHGYSDGTVSISSHRHVPRIIVAQALIEGGNSILNELIDEAKAGSESLTASLLGALLAAAAADDEEKGPDA